MANLKRRNPYDDTFLEDPQAETGPASPDGIAPETSAAGDTAAGEETSPSANSGPAASEPASDTNHTAAVSATGPTAPLGAGDRIRKAAANTRRTSPPAVPDPGPEPITRLNVDLPRDVHRQLKQLAVAQDRTISDIVRTLVTRALRDGDGS
jgi:CopG-like RHH_1 or ribbon-helix-helix domain, RHH_5